MSDETVVKVHGKYYTYEVVKKSGVWSTKFSVYKDGKYMAQYSSKAEAVKRAHKEAGPNAYES